MAIYKVAFIHFELLIFRPQSLVF